MHLTDAGKMEEEGDPLLFNNIRLDSLWPRSWRSVYYMSSIDSVFWGGHANVCLQPFVYALHLLFPLELVNS